MSSNVACHTARMNEVLRGVLQRGDVLGVCAAMGCGASTCFEGLLHAISACNVATTETVLYCGVFGREQVVVAMAFALGMRAHVEVCGALARWLRANAPVCVCLQVLQLCIASGHSSATEELYLIFHDRFGIIETYTIMDAIAASLDKDMVDRVMPYLPLDEEGGNVEAHTCLMRKLVQYDAPKDLMEHATRTYSSFDPLRVLMDAASNKSAAALTMFDVIVSSDRRVRLHSATIVTYLATHDCAHWRAMLQCVAEHHSTAINASCAAHVAQCALPDTQKAYAVLGLFYTLSNSSA